LTNFAFEFGLTDFNFDEFGKLVIRSECISTEFNFFINLFLNIQYYISGLLVINIIKISKV